MTVARTSHTSPNFPRHAGTIQLFSPEAPMHLESGACLPTVTVAYEQYGTLNAGGTNAILVCHALTGSAQAGGPGGWWEAAIGPGRAFDTSRYCVICTNILGSCYGTTGPTSVNPATKEPYGAAFPRVTVRDMVAVQHEALRRLGVQRLALAAGGSLGGMQTLEWALMYPEVVDAIAPIATAAQHSPWAIAFNEAARLAIMTDPAWQGGRYTTQPERGLTLARAIGMISYRAYDEFLNRFGRQTQPPDAPHHAHLFPSQPQFAVEGYLRHHGAKLTARFDANTFLTLSYAMDSHDVARGRGAAAEVLGRIHAHALCVGISTDILYPAVEQQRIASMIRGAVYEEVASPSGHDAFLIEFEQMNRIVSHFLENNVHDIA